MRLLLDDCLRRPHLCVELVRPMTGAMRAAAPTGDNQLQRQAQGYVVPDSFADGMRAGDIQAYDMFSGGIQPVRKGMLA